MPNQRNAPMRDRVELVDVAVPILIEAVAVVLFIGAVVVWIAVWSGA